MKRILTGIQSSGIPHLGNILGAIQPSIKLSKKTGSESFLFIADLHSFTQIKNANILKKNTFETASAWLACGIDTEKTVFYKQSDIPEVTELSWYLSCFFPYNRLKLAHAFKDKSADLENINSGLFTYPMLMAADILLYDADVVPVGKDQLQHIEFTRDIGIKFNNHYGEIFKIPHSMTTKDADYIPGIDNQKMSKSKNNIINIFESDSNLRKQIMRIQTDSKNISEPKDYNSCTIFKIFSLIANESEILDMKKNYIEGSIGYGDAKKLLFEKITYNFKNEREKFNEYRLNPEEVQSKLKIGSEKAKSVAKKTLKRIRSKLGY
tara:strand:+ start:18431 stop:19399 length:969 start_codon:yes stop_codon:yes gene_type:complete